MPPPSPFCADRTGDVPAGAADAAVGAHPVDGGACSSRGGRPTPSTSLFFVWMLIRRGCGPLDARARMILRRWTRSLLAFATAVLALFRLSPCLRLRPSVTSFGLRLAASRVERHLRRLLSVQLAISLS